MVLPDKESGVKLEKVASFIAGFPDLPNIFKALCLDII
jgi:hypothetical protein